MKETPTPTELLLITLALTGSREISQRDFDRALQLWMRAQDYLAILQQQK